MWPSRRREVDACVAWTGQRPVEWLLDHAPVERALVPGACHAHDAGRDRACRAQRRGGGPVSDHRGQPRRRHLRRRHLARGRRPLGHRLGQPRHGQRRRGTAELEYGQRLASRQRNVLASDAHNFVGDRDDLEAVAGGAQASGRTVAGLAAGQRADFVVLDAKHPLLQGLPSPDAMLSAHVFASHGGRRSRRCGLRAADGRGGPPSVARRGRTAPSPRPKRPGENVIQPH